MTDNDKMHEAFEDCPLHDGYGDDKRLEENREWFIAGWQAAKSMPVEHKQVADGLDEDISHAMRFYSVTDLVSLVRIQSEHVARLQKKLPPMRDEQPRNPRSGGE